MNSAAPIILSRAAWARLSNSSRSKLCSVTGRQCLAGIAKQQPNHHLRISTRSISFFDADQTAIEQKLNNARERKREIESEQLEKARERKRASEAALRVALPRHYQRTFSTVLPTTDLGVSSPVGKEQDKDEGAPPKPTFYVPKAERSATHNVFDMDDSVGQTRLARNDRTCPTRELNFTPAHWARHKSPFRRFRHIYDLLHSSPFQRLLFPDLFCVGTVAAGLTYYNEFVACTETVATMSSSAFAGATTAIGLLAGFRLNASYGRYEECRIFWGDINNTIRDLARQSMMWLPQDSPAQTRMIKLCQAFPLGLVFHLNQKGCHHNMKRLSAPGEASFEDRVQVEFEAELRDIYPEKGEDFERFARVKRTGGSLPIEVLTCMAECIATHKDDIDPIYMRELDEQCQRLCAAFGASERVLRTPLPTGFTRHASRLLFMWSNCLPFALYPVLGPLGTLPAALLSTYAVVGVEDISIQMEDPFDVLPLRQYSDGMFDGVKSIQQGFVEPAKSA